MNIKQIKLENISARKQVVNMFIIGEQQYKAGGRNQYSLFLVIIESISNMKNATSVLAIHIIVGDHPNGMVKRLKNTGYVIK